MELTGFRYDTSPRQEWRINQGFRNQEEKKMWYFTWILGVLLALSLGIINVMWYESEYPHDDQGDRTP